MKTRLLTSIAVLLLLAAPLSAAAPPAPKAPKIQLSIDKWDIGEVYQWDEPVVEVKIKNSGDADLIIQDVKASCGCTAAVVSEKTLKPGAEGILKASLAVFQLRGKVRKEIVLFTNDPAAPKKSLPVTGFVKQDKGSFAVFEPSGVDMGVVAPYEVRSFTLKLRNKGNVEMPIEGINLPEGFSLETAAPGRVAPRATAALKVVFRPAKDGLVQGEITASLANAQKEIKVPVVGYVSDVSRDTDAVIITPTGFKLGPDSTGGLRLGIKNGGGSKVEVEGVESSLEGLQPRDAPKELAPGEAGSITLAAPRGAVKPGEKGYIYIRLAIPVEAEAEAEDAAR